METEHFLFSGIVLFAVGAASALVPAKKTKTAAYLFSLLGSLSFLVLGLFLVFGGPVSFQAQPVSSIFEFSLRGDGFADFFVIIISILPAGRPLSLFLKTLISCRSKLRRLLRRLLTFSERLIQSSVGRTGAGQINFKMDSRFRGNDTKICFSIISVVK